MAGVDPFQDPIAHLDGVAAVVRAWIEALLHRTARVPEPAENVPRSRYAVAASDVVKLLVEAGRPDEVAVSAEAEAGWRAVVGGPGELPFIRLIHGLELDDAAARVVAVLAALEHDPELERMATFAWDDFTRKRPDVGFLIDLLGTDPARRVAVRAALSTDAPLRRWRVILVGGAADIDTVPPARRVVRLADRIIGHLHGDEAVDPVLDGVVKLVEAAPIDRVIMPAATLALGRRALHATGSWARVLVHGPSGVGKLMLVAALAAEDGRPVVRVDAGELIRVPERLDERMARVAREAALRGAAVVFRAGSALDDVAHGPVFDRFAALCQRVTAPVVWSCHQRPSWLVHAVPDLREVPVPAPAMRARVALWRQALGDDASIAGDEAIIEVAGRFALGGEAIGRAAARAAAHARLREPEAPRIELPDLTESARLMLQHRLGTVARRVRPGFDWDDLVLPDDTMETINEMLGFARHRAHLLEEWGFDRKLPYGRGVSAVLAGPPGTGKTMVAQIVAAELGYDLYVIELAQVVNKYIGETEKNLARVFDEAENSHAILFFDEADALFSKRTEVKTATDRYANLEVNYLLQRMESYNGVTLLATNLEQGIDEAFKRRVRFTIQFDMPEAPVRELLWRSMFPAATPLAKDVDWRRLAEKWELAGGHIKKAALRAASRALARGRDTIVTGEDLDAAAQLEYREMGRVG